MEQRANISRAYPRKTGINRELISSSKAYARKKKLISERKSLLGKALGLLPRLTEVLEMWNDLWAGDGTLYLPEVDGAGST